jgi:hypothetical protein
MSATRYLLYFANFATVQSTTESSPRSVSPITSASLHRSDYSIGLSHAFMPLNRQLLQIYVNYGAETIQQS